MTNPEALPDANHGWGRTDTAIILAIVAAGILLALTLGNDYGISWDEPLIGTYVERIHRSFATLQSKDSVFVDLHFYGPFYFLVADGVGRVLRSMLPSWTFHDGRHAAYFLSFVLATASVYVAGRTLTGRRSAALGALLMATQPLLFGHAFMNPKDIPFLGVFASAVAAGMLAVRFLPPRSALAPDPPGGRAANRGYRLAKWRRFWAEISRPARYTLIVCALLAIVFVAGIWLLQHVSLPLTLELTRQAVSGEAPALFQTLFERITDPATALPLDDYQTKVAGLHFRSEVYLAVGLALVAVISLTVLLTTTNKNLGRAFFVWWLIAAGLAGAATAIRVVGPMAGILACALLVTRLRSRSAPWIFLFVLVAGAVTYAFWPYLWGRPIIGLVEALQRASGSPWDGKVLFLGSLVKAPDLPLYFAPEILALQLTLPALLLGSVGAVMSLVHGWRNRDLSNPLVLWTWLLLPFAVALAFESVVYDNARQMLFALPPLFAMSSCAIEPLLRVVRYRAAQLTVALLLVVPGVVGIARLHPYEYVYYNELVGGLQGAEGRFELDYWATGFREAMETINDVAPAKATVAVAGSRQAAAPFARDDLDVWPQDDLGGPGRRPDFLIATTRWGIDLTTWPEAPTVWTVERLGARLAVVKDLRQTK